MRFFLKDLVHDLGLKLFVETLLLLLVTEDTILLRQLYEFILHGEC